MQWIGLIALGFIGLFLLLMLLAGIHERRPRVVSVSCLCLIPVLLVLLLFLSVPDRIPPWLLPAIGLLFMAGTLVTLIPWFPRLQSPDLSHAKRFDERNHMFARANLENHPDLYRRHYSANPEQFEPDREIHALPRLGEPGGKFYDPLISRIPDAAFCMLDRSSDLQKSRPLGRESNPNEPEQLRSAIQTLGRRYGALDIGFTKAEPLYWYSYAGRQAADWGREIKPDHPCAVVIVVSMDIRMMNHAPSLPVLMESSRGYVECAKIAHLVADFLSLSGFQARSHVDGHYEVICAPLAQSAGMGYVGRMGIFMHHSHGPCVRISVVTTDAPLLEEFNRPIPDDHTHMEHFCRICKKCADNCPSRSISDDEQATISRGFQHWSVNQESCYRFWRKIGTDCAVCIRSCPYTKPDTLVHRIARRYISRNPVNQWIALKLDDLFYGRRLTIPSRNPDLAKLL